MTTPLNRITAWCGEDWRVELDPLADAQPTLRTDTDSDAAEATITLPGARKSALDRDLVGRQILASNDDGVAYEGEITEINQQYSLDGRRLHILCEPGAGIPLFMPNPGQLTSGSINP